MTLDTEAKPASEATLPSDLDILRGRKVVVRLYDEPYDGGDTVPDSSDHEVRLSNNHVALLERMFESQNAMSVALQNRPFDTCRAVLSVALDMTLDAAGDRMISTEIDRYWAAVEGAFVIAFGQTEAMAGKAIASRLERQNALRQVQELRYKVETAQASEEIEAVCLALLGHVRIAAETAKLDVQTMLRKAKLTNGMSHAGRRSSNGSKPGSSAGETSGSSGA